MDIHFDLSLKKNFVCVMKVSSFFCMHVVVVIVFQLVVWLYKLRGCQDYWYLPTGLSGGINV